jgi:hypothetical protein
MSEKEVEINGKKYGEDTQITLKAKTLVWVIGVLIAGISTLATIGYFDIKSDVKEQKENFDKEKQEYMQEVNNMMEETLDEYIDKREDMIETIGEMKGDIKVILDRTSRNNDHNNTGVVNNVNGGLNVPTDGNLPNVNRNTNNSNTGIPLNNNGVNGSSNFGAGGHSN